MMKAVFFPGSSSVDVRDIPIPKPAAGEVLIKVQASAICGSEMKHYRSPEGFAGVPGHETVGIVQQNPNPGGPSEGARVALNIISGCGHCTYCLAGDRRFCKEQGYVNGGHAEYVLAPVSSCMPLPDDIQFDEGVLLGGDTLGVAFHTLSKIPVRPRDTVVVVGAGPVGSGFVAMLHYYGLRTVVVELSEYRRRLMASYDVEAVIDPAATDPVAAIRELTGGRGADVTIDATGHDAGVNLALRAARPQGIFVFAGAGRTATINPWEYFLSKELTAFGVWYFTDGDYFRLLDVYRKGLRVEPLLTHRMTLDDAPRAYELFAAAQSGKIIFVPG